MKRFICGLCKKNKKVEDFISDRKGLRKHLRENHRIMSDITNTGSDEKREIRKWWIVEEVD